MNVLAINKFGNQYDTINVPAINISAINVRDAHEIVGVHVELERKRKIKKEKDKWKYNLISIEMQLNPIEEPRQRK